jgi:hypothetical protein
VNRGDREESNACADTGPPRQHARVQNPYGSSAGAERIAAAG